LNSSITYGYQYLIDGVKKFADPLSMLIADPSNDGNINASTYPNPYPYPTGQTSGFISLFQTDTTSSIWQNDG
jgi:1,4-alpha-glucan branching enzyme